jgi:hypothetical protein
VPLGSLRRMGLASSMGLGLSSLGLGLSSLGLASLGLLAPSLGLASLGLSELIAGVPAWRSSSPSSDQSPRKTETATPTNRLANIASALSQPYRRNRRPAVGATRRPFRMEHPVADWG